MVTFLDRSRDADGTDGPVTQGPMEKVQYGPQQSAKTLTPAISSPINMEKPKAIRLLVRACEMQTDQELGSLRDENGVSGAVVQGGCSGHCNKVLVKPP